MRIKNLILYFFFPVFVHGQLYIDGQVLDKIKGTPLPGSRVTLYQFQGDSLVVPDSSGYNPFASSYYDSMYKKQHTGFADSNGYFLFTKLEPGVYRITAENLLRKTERGVYYEERESVICSVINCDTGLTIDVHLSVFCPFDSTRHLTHCPKCEKKDMLREFIYGLPSIALIDESRYIYTWDCSPPRCRPLKYCLRCKHEF